MYFSTVLVFLLTFKFIQPTNAIMPFDYKHKEETDQFLEKVTKDLNIYQSNVLDSCVNKFLQMKLVDSSKFNFGILNCIDFEIISTRSKRQTIYIGRYFKV